MSQTTQTSNGQFCTPYSMATKAVFDCIAPITNRWIDTQCSCPCICEDNCELALHDDVGTSNYANDVFTFVTAREYPDDGYDLKLYKSTALHTPINIDAYLAEVFDFGEVDGNEDEDLAGFILSWFQVWSYHGNGDYYISGTITRQGIVFPYTSKKFMVREFSCDIAERTVKIQAFMNGFIMSDIMDLSGTNWLTSIRLNGKLYREKPKYIETNFINLDYIKEEIQKEIKDQWTLELWPMDNQTYELLIYNLILNNGFYVSDYNVNAKRFDQIALYPVDISDFRQWDRSSKQAVTLKFESSKQDHIKRNFKNNFTFTTPTPSPAPTTEHDSILYAAGEELLYNSTDAINY